MTPRLYISQPLKEGDLIPLPTESAHYLLRVLRLKREDKLIVFNGQGGEWFATLQQERPLAVQIEKWIDKDYESPLSITLIAALPKGDRFEWIIQKSVELGVKRIIPLISARTIRRPKANRIEKTTSRWRKIALEAAEQSQRTALPQIDSPISWDNLRKEPLSKPGFIFWEKSETPLKSFKERYPQASEIALLIGPEGGFSQSEVLFAKEQLKFHRIRLGPRTLRAETAALAAVTTIQALWGDLL
ncbi:16S rRNA (uracil(1498)-N(3))-methyltransferase [Magnetococcales bacterium HHB-1]